MWIYEKEKMESLWQLTKHKKRYDNSHQCKSKPAIDYCNTECNPSSPEEKERQTKYDNASQIF